MSDHSFDLHSLQEWLRGLEKPNEDECVKALAELDNPRIKEIVIAHIYEQKTFKQIGKTHGISKQRAHALFWQGIKKIRKKIGR